MNKSDENEEKKRKRSVNFSSSDKDLLFSIVFDYKNIVECKKTDGMTWREKEAAWEQITAKYNSQSTTPRTLDALRKCFLNKKKEVRQAVAKERMEVFKTGGGIPEQ